MNELDENYKKIFKHFLNGITHNVILWIISKESIHGYGIMKKLDEFLDFDDNYLLKSNSSKIYPILRKMESNGIIVGEWKVVNNKRVKYYSITEDGEFVLDNIKNYMIQIWSNDSWMVFFKDMTGGEIVYEKCE